MDQNSVRNTTIEKGSTSQSSRVYFRYVVALCAGGLLGIGTIIPALWPCSLVGFAVVVYLLAEYERRSIYAPLFLSGAVLYGCTFYALYWSTLPLDWLGLSGAIGPVLIASIWLLTVALFAGVFTVALLAATYKTPSRIGLVIRASLLFVFADAIAPLLFSLVFAGSNSTIGAHFTMGSPGYQLAESPFLRQTASMFGIYGLVFLQGVCGGVLYLVLTHTKGPQRAYYALFAFAVLVLFVFLPLPESHTSTHDTVLTVAAMSTYKDGTRPYRHQLLRGEVRTLPSSVSVVAVPEDERFVQNVSKEFARELNAQLPDTWIIDSGTIPDANGAHSTIFSYHTLTGAVATSSKEYLMLFGEYLPALYTAVGRILGRDDVVAHLNVKHRYQRNESTLLVLNGETASVRLCAEAMSPVFYARDVAHGAGILFNLASHGWFHRSEALHVAAQRVGRVRAVESGRWYVRAGSESPAYIIDHRGRVVRERDWLDRRPILYTVPIYTHRTPYVWFVSLWQK